MTKGEKVKYSEGVCPTVIEAIFGNARGYFRIGQDPHMRMLYLMPDSVRAYKPEWEIEITEKDAMEVAFNCRILGAHYNSILVDEIILKDIRLDE